MSAQAWERFSRAPADLADRFRHWRKLPSARPNVYTRLQRKQNVDAPAALHE